MRKFVIEFDGYTPKTIEPIEQALAEAFQNGLHVGESKCEHCDEYKRGLDDAWEAVETDVVAVFKMLKAAYDTLEEWSDGRR